MRDFYIILFCLGIALAGVAVGWVLGYAKGQFDILNLYAPSRRRANLLDAEFIEEKTK